MVNILTNKNFFDELAPEYDQLISFEKAVKNKMMIFAKLITPEMKFAADLGCGSGVDSIALTLLGLNVEAIDPSREMIKAAKVNAKREGLSINFHNCPVDSIPNRLDNKFDIVISLGNTFTNIETGKFNISVAKCFNILKNGGILLIQVMNYEKVVSENRRIIKITEGVESYYVRFYDFLNELIIFNILSFKKEKPSDYRFISTKLFPHGKKDFRKRLKEAGFASIEFFSDFNLSTFNAKQSKDLIIKAVKS